MASDLDAFEKIFCGVWKHERDENFEEALRKMGTPEDAIRVLVDMKPTITMERRGDSIYMKYEMGPKMAHDFVFKLGEEFEAKDPFMNPPLFHTKEVATFKDGMCTFQSKTQITGPGKIDTHSEFFVKDGLLHTPTSPLNDTSFNANRIYRRCN